MTREEALALTEEIRKTTQDLYVLFLRAYKGNAHVALGYASWREYVSTEFDMSQANAYQILDQGRIISVLESFEHARNDDDPLPNVRQAKALAPVLRKEGPDRMREVWSEALSRTQGRPTAEVIREIRSEERCPPLTLQRVPIPFKFIRDEIMERLHEIMDQHELTSEQNMLIGRIVEAVDALVETASPEDNRHYEEMK
jgi:hypothetical protein